MFPNLDFYIENAFLQCFVLFDVMFLIIYDEFVSLQWTLSLGNL